MSPIELGELRGRVARVEASIASIAGMPFERRIVALESVARTLADGERSLGRDLRTALEATSGLSSEGIAWALDTTLGAITRDSLAATVALARRGASGEVVPRGLVAVILSANVTTAPVFALTMPLLFGNAVIAKASRRDDIVARAFLAALEAVDPTMSAALDVVVFDGGDVEREDILITRANCVSVYGSDSTSSALRARTPVSATFLVHGHGLGVGFVAREVMRDPALRHEAIGRFALDVAAYDQRGCLSPHAIVVEGDYDEARAFAVELADVGLRELAGQMPRGPLPASSAAAQLAFRSLGIARGELFEGEGYCVSVESDSPLRASPGYRNVQVVPGGDRGRFGSLVAGLGVHLKVIGLAGDARCREAIVRSLAPPVAPRLVAAGSMQSPPLAASWDGELPFTGLVRYAAGP